MERYSILRDLGISVGVGPADSFIPVSSIQFSLDNIFYQTISINILHRNFYYACSFVFSCF